MTDGNERTKRMAAKFPRLAELDAEIACSSAYTGWFSELSRKAFETDLAQESYGDLESQLATLPRHAWTNLKRKILQQQNSNHRELLSLLNEAAGYKSLQKLLSERGIEFDAILQPSDSNAKTPDWIALRGEEIVGALEVKTVFESDEQNARIESNTQKVQSGQPPAVQRVTPGIPEGLLQKIKCDVQIASKQLKAVLGRDSIRAVYVIANVDYETAQATDCANGLQGFLRSLNRTGVLVIGDLRSPYL